MLSFHVILQFLNIKIEWSAKKSNSQLEGIEGNEKAKKVKYGGILNARNKYKARNKAMGKGNKSFVRYSKLWKCIWCRRLFSENDKSDYIPINFDKSSISKSIFFHYF